MAKQVPIQLGYKNAAWFTANPTLVLKAGQMVFLSTTSQYKIGDGTTALSALSFCGGVTTGYNLTTVLGYGNTTSGKDITLTANDKIKLGSGTAVIFNDSTETDSNHIFLATNSAISGYSHIFLKDGGNEFHDESVNAYISFYVGSPPSASISLDHTNNGKINVFNGTGGLNLNGATYFPNLTASRILSLDANNKVVSSYGTTGSGSTLVLSTSPTFTTDITTPLIIGGSAVGSTIQYKGTSGNGTSTVAAHQFLVGNNGATAAASIYNSGQVSIGNYASPTNLRALTVGQDTAYMSFGSLVGTTSQPAIYLNQATPSPTNYTITSDGSNVYLNTQSTTGFCYITTGNNTRFYFGRSGMASNFAADVSGATTTFSFITPAHTGQTASTEISNFKVNGASKTWAAGAITTQRWNYFTANTAAFASASTIAESFGMYVEAATAGANATITNNFALGLTAGTATLKFGHVTGDTTAAAIYLNQSTPTNTNYSIYATSSTTALNGASTGVALWVGGSERILAYGLRTSGSASNFNFTTSNNTGMTASTEIPGYLYNSYSRQWATGAITTQREKYYKTVTYSFVGASTITNAYGLYVEAATAGTNATITNNYAAGFNGAIRVIGALGSSASIMVDNSTGGYGALWSDGTQGLIFRITSGDVVQFGDINAKNKGIGFVTNGSTRVSIGNGGGMTFADANNITFNATTGTKIGTATTEKLAFWNATPIVQPTTAVAAATFVANTSGIVDDTATFDGYTIGQVIKALRNEGLLQ